jgi:hypothetical protein
VDSAQRRVTLKWDDIADGVWTIATEQREKGNAGVLKLPPVAVAIIEAQDEIVGNPYVFAGSLAGRRHKSADRSGPPHFNSWSARPS